MSTLITDKVDKAAVHNEKLDTSAYLPHTPWLQFLLVCCLFALWGMAGNLNDILIAQFKKGFDLTDTQTALVQSIFPRLLFCRPACGGADKALFL